MADLPRSAGGLLFASGALVLFIRKASHDEWSDFARFLTVLVPAIVLYLLALRWAVTLRVSEDRYGNRQGQPRQTVLMVASLLLWPIALFQFLHWVGANTDHLLYDAAVFAVTGLLAAYGAWRARVAYAALLAGLSLLLAWVFLFEKLLNHPSANTGRWLLVVAAVALFAVSGALARTKAIGAGEIATAGGIAAVAAGVLGVIVGTFVSAFGSLLAVGSSSSAMVASAGPGASSGAAAVTGVSSFHHAAIHPGHGSQLPSAFARAAHTSGLQHFGWDLYLLVVSLALVWVGSRERVRGMGYVGTIGLLAFVISVAAQITRLESGQHPSARFVGWPLVLIVVGIVGLAAPDVYRRRSSPPAGQAQRDTG